MGIKIELTDGTKIEIDDMETQVKFEELVKKHLPKKERNFVEEGYSEKKYFIDFDGKVEYANMNFDGVNNFNEFTNRQYAEKVDFKQYIERKLLWYKDKYDEVELDWDDEQQGKYFIRLESDYIVYSKVRVSKVQGAIYFSSRELVERIIEEMKDDLIQYFNLGL